MPSISQPLSVGLVGGDERVRAAHGVAVATALSELELLAQARIGAHHPAGAATVGQLRVAPGPTGGIEDPARAEVGEQLPHGALLEPHEGIVRFGWVRGGPKRICFGRSQRRGGRQADHRLRDVVARIVADQRGKLRS